MKSGLLGSWRSDVKTRARRVYKLFRHRVLEDVDLCFNRISIVYFAAFSELQLLQRQMKRDAMQEAERQCKRTTKTLVDVGSAKQVVTKDVYLLLQRIYSQVTNPRGNILPSERFTCGNVPLNSANRTVTWSGYKT